MQFQYFFFLLFLAYLKEETEKITFISNEKLVFFKVSTIERECNFYIRHQVSLVVLEDQNPADAYIKDVRELSWMSHGVMRF